MKVLVIGSRVPYPLHDGGAIASFNMLKGIAEIGCEVDFITLNTRKHFVKKEVALQKMPFLKYYAVFEINTNINPFKAFINLFSSKSYNIERFYHKKFEQLLISRIETKKYDIIHFEGLFVAKYADAMKKNKTQTPLLLRQHNIEYQIWQRLAQNETNFFKKWYLKLLVKRIEHFEKKIINEFNWAATITKTDEETIKQWRLGGKLTTIPSGFDYQPIKETTIDYNAIYHIGSMEWLPNIEAMQWFIEKIMPLVVSKNNAVKFYMAGKKMPTEFKQYQAKNIAIMGEVENLEDFIANKSILVVPLKSGSGLRIKTIEAMMQGKAVITTSVGAQGLPVENNKHCIIADTENEIADATLLLINDTNKRNQIADAGRELIIANYDNKVVAKQWLKLYEEMTGIFYA